MIVPSWKRFQDIAHRGNLVPIYREILADLETPVSAFLKLGGGEFSYLLESVEGAEKLARYSIIGIDPKIIVRVDSGTVEVRRPGSAPRKRKVKDPLEPVEKLFREIKPVELDGLPPFYGGAVGFLGYDVVRKFEKIPEIAEDDLHMPDAFFVFAGTILVFDNLTHSVKVVTYARTGGGTNLEKEYRGAMDRIENMIGRLREPVKMPTPPLDDTSKIKYKSTFTREAFCRQVRRIKKYIREGDIFQAVLSQRLETVLRSDPFDVYRALRTINPSPYMYYLNFDDMKVIGSSPEVLVRESAGRLELRPVAGTRPRGRDLAEDESLARDLFSDEKELAEHVMLVDLGRNDLGRVSEFGSVVTDELKVLEKYSHVMHIVSNVTGQLRKGLTPFDVVRACFPAGTVSGAPKIRAMEIIEELEPVRRGLYAGAVGYFGYARNMDMCIGIRTIVTRGRRAYIGAGAGIVADSVPEIEFEETLSKADALKKAIEKAAGGLE